MPRTYRKKPKQVPQSFEPGFLSKIDQRTKVATILKGNKDRIIDDVGGPEEVGHVKNALVERFVWLEAILQSIEQDMAESSELKAELLSRWIQAVNSLSGLAKALGVERRTTSTMLANLYAPAKGDADG